MSCVLVWAVSTMIGSVSGPTIGTQATADLEPVHPRQAQVEHEHVGLVLGDRAQAVLAVGDGDDAITGILEDASEHAPDGAVILDDCHAWPGWARAGRLVQFVLPCVTTT